MKIIIAPDSFKESLDASSAAQAIADGMRQGLPDAHYELIPMADGGEGTVDALVAATNGRIFAAEVCGPLGAPVMARYGVLGDGRTAVIEMAAASGLILVPPERRDPMKTTSYGTGQLIRAASRHRIEKILIGLGGSATSEGGAGMLQALGARFYDALGQEICEPINGRLLAQVASVDRSAMDPRLSNITFETACDVDNPLTGPTGAAATFAPQKGATPAQVVALDTGLAQFFQLVERISATAVTAVPGSGAAGGMGAAMLAFLDSSMRAGVDIVIDAVRLRDRVRGANLIITGEGRIDAQTWHGKAPAGVARIAAEAHVPIVGIGGSLVDDGSLLGSGMFDALEAAVTRPMSTTEALTAARENLQAAAFRVACWLRLLAKLRP